MSLFHKNINEKLAQHIFELEGIGLLTDDWYWDSRKVLRLKRIDEELIRDLLEFYKTKKTDREKFITILQKLSALQRILKSYMKKSDAGSKDKRFVVLIDRFIQEIETLLDNFPLRIGITGYVTQKFDVQQALKYVKKAFDRIDKKYPKRKREVVGKLIDAGIYSIAYREAVRRRWKTVGIEFAEFQHYRLFPVNQRIGVGKISEFSIFMNVIDILVRVGGLYRARKECDDARNNKKEVYEYNVKATLTRIADIDNIGESRNSDIRTRKDVSTFVEKPLLKACLILYDKNIRTLDTSANAKNIGGNAVLVIDYGSLSEENKRIGLQFGRVYQADNRQQLSIVIPIEHPDIKVSEIERKSVQIANAFKHQKMTWVRKYTWEYLLKAYDMSPKDAERLGWTPADFPDYYYDPQEKLFYLSEEHYRKSKK